MYSRNGCRLNRALVNCTVVTKPSHTTSPIFSPSMAVQNPATAINFPSTNAARMLAISDMKYEGPALFCISAIFALSFGS